jgi:aromatic ring-opening dioxygenase catalytic subunit (LigB family)
MDWNPPDAWNRMADFLKNLASTLPRTPKAIVMVSAHWMESNFSVTSGVQPGLNYDYYGFPAHTYELKYPAPGAPALADQIVKTLTAAGIASAENSQRGFDHGMFIPLKLIFPQANIPVVQLSLHNSLSPIQHLDAGRALETLRDQDVLIIGSGMSFHNMRAYGNPQFGPVSDAFDAWLTKAVESGPKDRQYLLSNWEQAPSARQCHPPRAEEHLIPLMTVAGTAGNDAGHKVFSDRVMETTLSAFTFG